MRAAFEEVSDLIAELLKVGRPARVRRAHLPDFLADISPSGYVFAALALLAVRPAALGVALARSGLAAKEWAAAAWFGPKGFASVVYGLIVLQAGIPVSDTLFHLTALVIVISILAHSSTDVVLARRFAEAEKRDAEQERAAAP